MRQLLRRGLLRIAGRFLGRGRPRATPVRRVLVIKPDHLGDVLLLTPALAELRARFPGAHITLLIGPWSEAAVRANPAIDTLLVCPFPGFTRRPKADPFQPYLLLLRMAILLRGGYDTALVARDDHWWGALLALVAGIPRRVGFAAPDVAPLLTHPLPYDPHAHVAVQGLELVKYLAGTEDDLRPPMHAPVAAPDTRWAERWLVAHDYDPDARLAAIHPGAGGGAKLWIIARWAMVADALMADGWQVVLTGGPGERALVAEIAGRLARAPLVIAGEATLGQLAALYARCDLVLGVDSGPMHLATAVGARTVVLYGPIDHVRFGPWGPAGRHRVVRSGLWCSPCGAVEACPRGTWPAECMTTISVSHVLTAAARDTGG